jgi:tetratricopeptide (TPR) repeat protein
VNPDPRSSWQRDFASALEIEDYLHCAWRHKWIVLALSIAGLSCAAVWVRFFPAEFVSRAVIRFIPPKVSERYVTTNSDAWAEQRTAALSQTLSSSLTARKMVEGGKLYPELRRFMTSADLVPRFQQALSVHSFSWKGAPGARPVASIEIAFRYSDPAVAKQIVQQMVESVYETNERYRGDQSMSTAQFLTEQADSARERLEELEDEIGQLGRPDRTTGDHEWALRIQNLYSVENRLGHIQSSLRNLRSQLADKLDEIVAVEGEIRRLPQTYLSSTESATLEGTRLRILHNEAIIQVNLFRERYTPDHPDLIEALKRREETRAQLEAQLERDADAARARAKRQLQSRLDHLRADRDALTVSIRSQEAEEASFARKSSELRASIYSTPADDTEYLRLMREYGSLGDQYRVLFRKEQESKIASEVDRQGQGEMVELLDPPSVSSRPEFPSAPVKLLLGAGIGFIAGLLFSLMRVQLRPTLRTARHLALWPGAVLLADIPACRLPAPDQTRRIGTGRWLPKLTGAAGLLAISLLAILASTGCSLPKERTRDSWLRFAAKAASSGDLETAVRCYRSAIEIDARSATAHNEISRILLATGEVESALGHLVRAAELLPADKAVQTRLADLLYRIFHADPSRSRATLSEIEEQATRLIARWPDSPDGYRAKALVLCERGRLQEAAAMLDGGLRATGRHPAMLVELASIVYRLGDKERAEQLLRPLIAAGSNYGQAYDLLYLQLRDRRLTAQAGAVLREKWLVLGNVDSGLQYAAHLDSIGERGPVLAHINEVCRRLSGNPEAIAQVGSFWLSRGEHERARLLYERGAADFPSHRGEFIGKLSEIAVAAGRQGEAESMLNSAILASPRDLALRAHRAALRLDSPQTAVNQAARLELELLLKRMPTSAFVRFHLGRSYMKVGDIFRAGREFERSIRLDPNYAPGWLALAENEYRSGNVALARSTLDTLLSRAPRYASALLLRARVLGDMGQNREMLQTLELAAEAGASEQAVAIERARLMLAEGDAHGAVRLLRASAREGPANPPLAVALAWAEIAGGNPGEAIAVLDLAASAYPGSHEILQTKAGLLLRLGRHADAAALFARLRAEVPGSAHFSVGLADSLALSGRLREAAAEYARAQTLQGAPPDVWVKAAAVHNALGDLTAAQTAYEQALARDGSNPIALNNLAYLLGRNGRQLEYALQLAQNAGQILPDSDEIRDTLVYVSLRMGLKQQAIEILDRAAARSKSPTRDWYQSLRAQLRNGTAEEVLRRMEDARRERKTT